ncbi:hypothetical protein NWP10_12165, partial [Micrococcus sp. HG099]|uniref:hypothetical protein n=1 Tax=Micrococcus sp. HG099 TaxID=2969755 RepID=UPI00215B06EE
APAPAATPAPAAATPAPALATPAPAAAAPTPVYPSAPGGPAHSTPPPSLVPLDSDEHGFGDRLAADGRVVPSLGILTESIHFAVLNPEEPYVDQNTLIMLARSLPLEGRIVMLTVDVADPGADEAAMRADAEATARAMVLEYRTGMPEDPPSTGPDGFPLLDPPWVMTTVMLPPADDDGALAPVVHLATGTGVTPGPDLVSRLEADLRDARPGTEHTGALEALVRTAVAHTTPSDQVRALAEEDEESLFADRPAWQWAALGALVLGLVAVGVLALRRRRRGTGTGPAE